MITGTGSCSRRQSCIKSTISDSMLSIVEDGLWLVSPTHWDISYLPALGTSPTDLYTTSADFCGRSSPQKSFRGGLPLSSRVVLRRLSGWREARRPEATAFKVQGNKASKAKCCCALCLRSADTCCVQICTHIQIMSHIYIYIYIYIDTGVCVHCN